MRCSRPCPRARTLPRSSGRPDTRREFYTFDDLHAAYAAGIAIGQAKRRNDDIEQEIHDRTHARALEMLGMARSLAAEKGPAWAALIEDQAAAPWEGR